MIFLIGTSSGLLRTVHGKGSLIPDLIPSDFVVNSIIVAAASVASSEHEELKIYNCTSSKQQPISWNAFLDLSRETLKECPKVISLLGGRMCSNYFFYLLCFLLFQLIPAVIIDLCFVISARKAWAVNFQTRMFASLKKFEYFLKSSWELENQNFVLLHKLVSFGER